MYTKNDFLESVGHEIRVCQHLHSKLDPKKLDYQPGEGMRTTLELLQYLSWCAAGPTDALIHDWSVIGKYQEAGSTVGFEDFPARMDAQYARLEELLNDLGDEDLAARETGLPWGATTKLGAALVNLPLKFIGAYKLQLFDHAKATGAIEISTHNAWLGMDKPAE